MKSIRIGVFETNSSSTHSLTICSKAEFEAFKSGDLVLNNDDDKLYTKDEMMEIAEKEGIDTSDSDAVDEWMDDNGHKQNGDYESEYLESFEQYYTTKSGDEIVAFGVYGRDG